MPAASVISYDALPNGDSIYRLYWGGQIQLANTEDEAPRLVVWLKEVDSQGRYIPDKPAVRVVMSAGSFPRFHIGSLWQHQAPLVSSKLTEPEPVEFEIEAQASWTPVRANEKNVAAEKGPDGRSHDWINPSDYKLKFDEGSRVATAAHTSWVVLMKSVNGEELIVPCHEVFRAFYAGSSELAWRLLTGPWHAIKSHFLKSAESSETIDGSKIIRLEPESGMSKGVLPFLGCLIGSKAMREGANRIHTDLVASVLEDGVQSAWIRAVPPFVNQRFRIIARALPLTSRPGYLITKIEGASCPLQGGQLVYVQDEFVVDLGEMDAGNNQESAQVIHSQQGNEIDRARVAKSGQRRDTKRRFHLGIGTGFWLDAPRPRKEVRSIHRVQPPTVVQDPLSNQLVHEVGVGGAVGSKAPQHGSLELEDETIGRMAAIQDLVASLTGTVIIKWTEWPLVNRTPIESNEYCALPTDVGDDKSRAWVHGDGGEIGEVPRLAWVIRMTVAGQDVYWVEVEHQKEAEKYCSIALKVLSGADLSEATLRGVLNECVKHKGIWPKHAPDQLAATIKWSKGKHYPDGVGGLRASTILIRLTDLGVSVTERRIKFPGMSIEKNG